MVNAGHVVSLGLRTPSLCMFNAEGKDTVSQQALQATFGACNMIGEVLELLGPQRPLARVGPGKPHNCFLTHGKQRVQGLHPEAILFRQ